MPEERIAESTTEGRHSQWFLPVEPLAAFNIAVLWLAVIGTGCAGRTASEDPSPEGIATISSLTAAIEADRAALTQLVSQAGESDIEARAAILSEIARRLAANQDALSELELEEHGQIDAQPGERMWK